MTTHQNTPTRKSRHEIDPELHALRLITRIASEENGRAGSELEMARFQLFQAFERRDAVDARRWARALRIGLRAIDLGDSAQDAQEALEYIEEAIG